MNGGTIKSEEFRVLCLPITTFVFDVDGVFTDGKVALTDGGEWIRGYHTRDGSAAKKAIDAGYALWIITGGRGRSITDRFELLGAQEVCCVGHQPKEEVVQALIQKYRKSPQELCYMGDDILDVEAMKRCGLRTCPKDACQDVLDVAQWRSKEKGGEGCVRELLEYVLRLHQKW